MLSPKQYRQLLEEDIQLGYGLMSYTWRAEPVPMEQAFETIKKVIEMAGDKKALFNVGEFYGPLLTNYKLLQSYFAKYPEDRGKVIISAKGAIDAKKIAPNGEANFVAASIENAVREFDGFLDIFEPARIDMELARKNGEVLFPRETFDTIVQYIKEGKVGGISLSEVTEDQIRAIHKEYSDYLVCVEVELSMFSTDILQNGVMDACNELGLPVIAYSPLGRGLLTGTFSGVADVPKGDFRQHYKRFQQGSFEHNQQLVQFLRDEIQSKRDDGSTLAQIAIAWIHGISKLYKNSVIIPIPSGTTVDKVSQNFRFVELSDTEMASIDNFLKEFTTAGGRYDMAT